MWNLAGWEGQEEGGDPGEGSSDCWAQGNSCTLKQGMVCRDLRVCIAVSFWLKAKPWGPRITPLQGAESAGYEGAPEVAQCHRLRPLSPLWHANLSPEVTKAPGPL